MFLLTKILATRYMQSYIKKQKLRKKEIKQLCQYILPAPLSLNVQMSCFKTSPTFLHSICLECLDSLIKKWKSVKVSMELLLCTCFNVILYHRGMTAFT